MLTYLLAFFCYIIKYFIAFVSIIPLQKSTSPITYYICKTNKKDPIFQGSKARWLNIGEILHNPYGRFTNLSTSMYGFYHVGTDVLGCPNLQGVTQRHYCGTDRRAGPRVPPKGYTHRNTSNAAQTVGRAEYD